MADLHDRPRSIGLLFFYVVSVVVFLFNGWFLNSNFETVRMHQDATMHASEVISEMDLLISSLKDIETGGRGFLLTRKEEYLEPYNAGRIEVWDHFARLRELTAGNASQRELLNQVDVVIRGRADAMKKLVVETQQGGTYNPNGATAGEGKYLMDQLRNLVAHMKETEQKVLAETADRARSSEARFFIFLAISTGLCIVVSSIAFQQFRRNQNRTQAEAEKRQRESWVASNDAAISQMLSGDVTVDIASQRLMDHLAHTLKVPAANLYLASEDGLHLASSIGSRIDTAEKQRVQDGLPAEALRKDGLWEISEVPEDYWEIESGLGGSLPRSLLFLPLPFQGRNIGVLEIAAFETPDKAVRDLLTAISRSAGVGLSAAQSRARLQELLERSQQQSEELQAQQEELRTNNEELEEQARTLEKQQQILHLQNQELATARRDVEMKANDLERLNQYKSEFLAKMSHELRTPLNSLLILATLLIENKEGNLNEQQRDFARSIHSAGNDLLGLINDILDLAKIEARKMTLKVEPFEVKSLVGGLRSTFEAQSRVKGVDFVVDVTPEMGDLYMRTDRLRLEQILRNFLSNAIKFTDQGKITVRVERGEGGDVAFSVQDTGVGIPADKQDLVFEAFEQADSSVSRRFGGTGLGLTISRELANLLSGKITLESTEGLGSRFTLTIPQEISETIEEEDRSLPRPVPAAMSDRTVAARAPVAIPAASADVSKQAEHALSEVKAGEKTILIVEDDPAFRQAAVEAVRGHGFAAIEAADGETALEIVRRQVPSGILLDIRLPGLSGMSLLEIFKQMPTTRHVPTHVISAAEVEQSVLRMGAAGYHGKPVTLEGLRAALTRLENIISKKVRQLLIIEDDERQNEAMRQLIQGPDVEIHSVRTGEDAMKKMKSVDFDCLILDLTLPDLSGFHLLEKMGRLEQPLPPIVIYTGKDLTAVEESELRKYSDSIIIKGAKSPERLLDEVNLFLHRVEALLPEDKRQMLDQLRNQEKSFEGKTVLLVDDDLRNLFALTSALETRGLNVRVARNGIEALQALDENSDIDVVLMDLMMPKMDGLEAIRRLRANPKFKDLPVVALTAKAMKGDREKCIEAGASDYLPKPINLPNLLSVLKVWLSPKGIFA